MNCPCREICKGEAENDFERAQTKEIKMLPKIIRGNRFSLLMPNWNFSNKFFFSICSKPKRATLQ
jgi:hypothetical protein